MIKITLISYLLIASSLAIEVKVDKTPTKAIKEKKSEKRDAPIVNSGYEYSEPSHQVDFGQGGHIAPSDSYGTPLGAPLNEHSYAAFSQGSQEESLGHGGEDFSHLFSQLGGGDHSYAFEGQQGHEVAGSYEAPSYSGLDFSALQQSQSHGGEAAAHGIASQASQVQYKSPHYTTIAGLQTQPQQGGGYEASSLGHQGASGSYGAPQASSYANIDFSSIIGQSHGAVEITPSKEIAFTYEPMHASSGGGPQTFGSAAQSYKAPAVATSGGSTLGSSQQFGYLSGGPHVSNSYGAPSVSQGQSSGSFKSYSAPAQQISSSYGAPSHSFGSHGSGFGQSSSSGGQSYKAPASFSHGISHGSGFGSGISHGSSLGGGSYGAPSYSSHGNSGGGGISSFGGHKGQEQGPSYASGHKGLRHYSGPSHSHGNSHISSGPSNSYFSAPKGSYSPKIIPMTFSKVPISSFSSYVQSKPNLHHHQQTAFKPSAYLGSISEGDSYSHGHGSGSQSGGYEFAAPAKTYIPPKKTYIPPSHHGNHGPPSASYGVPSSHNYLHQGNHHGGESSYYHH